MRIGSKGRSRTRGFDVLIDRQEIYAFEDWWKRIEALIGRADTVVFVLSPDAVKSDVALKEVAYAASLNKRFAPIVCRRAEDGAVPEPLRRLNFIFFDDPERFDTSANALADALETDITWIRQHTEYGEAERRWSSGGKSNGLLLQSPTLDLAEHWLTSRPRNAPEPTKEIQNLVLASRKRASMSRRVRKLAQTSIFGLLVGIIAVLVGWINHSFIAEQWHYVTVAWPYVLSAAQEQALTPGQSFKECAQDCPEMVVVPAGSFTMGSPVGQGIESEHPRHDVTITKPFAVSKFEVTFAEWDACAGYGDCDPHVNADQWGRGREPAINVSWDDAKTYINWLSRFTHKQYRLLSEAEYEYAARAGTQTAYPWGDDVKLNAKAMANCDGCGSKWDRKQPAPVGSFESNLFGLFDMVGNVHEWVEDCNHDSYQGAPTDGSAWTSGGHCSMRVVRGGSYINYAIAIRSGSHTAFAAVFRSPANGFRVARTLDTR